MSAAEILEQIRALPPDERREIVERIEEEFADELSSEQVTELERRAAELRNNPKVGISWEQVRAEAKQRLKSRAA
jgi:putative addiction module component (TIGR02574 family)